MLYRNQVLSLFVITFIFGPFGASEVFAQQNLSSELRTELLQESESSALAQAQRRRRPSQHTQARGGIVEVNEAPVVTPPQSQRTIVVRESQQPLPSVQSHQFQNPQFQPAQPQYIQQQPTTHVQAAPLTESRAEKLRRERQEAELQTERKIVEKLENSRLEEEKKRAEALFGDKLNSSESSHQEVQSHQQTQHAPPQQYPEVVEVGGSSEDLEQSEIHHEIEESVREEVRASEETLGLESHQAHEHRFSISGLVGVADYPDAVNIDSDSSFGVGVEWEFVDQTSLELGVLFSEFDIDRFTFAHQRLEQLGINLAVKHTIKRWNVVRPFIGGVVSYTRREYQSPFFGGGFGASRFSTFNNSFQDVGETDAFDVGINAGVNLNLSQAFAIGFDYRYFTNVTNDADDIFNPTLVEFIEDSDYQVFSLVGKFTF